MELTFKEKKQEAKDIKSFTFSPAKKLIFQPGQYVELELKNAGKHMFSLTNTPSEENIAIATRMTGSEYKQALDKLNPGDKALLKGPFGMFTLRPDHDMVMIAGGIGITPMMSITRYASESKVKQRITLFHFNKTPEDTAFMHELKVLEAKNKMFKYHPVMTRPQESKQKWTGLTGHLTIEMIKNTCEIGKETLFYIAGPPKMVSELTSVLINAKIPLRQIIAENFMGY